MTTTFVAERLSQVISAGHPGFSVRAVSADAYVPACGLKIGSKMLSLFGLHDEWRPVRQHSQVFTIDRAIVTSSSGIVGLETGQVIEDTLDHTSPMLDGYERRGGHTLFGLDGLPRAEGGFIQIRAKPAELPGRHLSLLLGGHTNHFHWLLMNFARLALLDASDLRVDSILVPPDLTPLHLEAISLVKALRGIPLQPVHYGQSFCVGRLVLPWNIASGYGVNSAAVAFLREIMPSHDRRTRQRIYIDRRMASNRRLVNEAELIHELRRIDVEPVLLEGLSLHEQSRVFQQASLIIAPHGAGLTNMVWAGPGSRVIELMPSGVMNWCYRHLAAASDHTYDCVLGRSHPSSATPPFLADWTISPTHVFSAAL